MDLTILYEFIGTLAIVYGAAKYSDALPIVLAIFVIAKTVTSGHLNPAITFFYYLSGKIDASTALMYVISQLTAAFVVFKAYH
jgi:glycerol uptake facilitator-like aquaporin